MSISCYSILKLNAFERIRLAAGKNGLYRPLSWPCICTTPSISQWLHGGELLFITGSFFQTDENSLMTLIDECVEKNLAGLVVLIGGESQLTLTEAVCRHADENNLPLFEMPWDLRLVDVMQEISEMILSQKALKDTKQRFLFDLIFSSDRPHKYEQLSTLYGLPLRRFIAVAVFRPISDGDVDISDLLLKLSYYQAIHCSLPDASFISVKHISTIINFVMADTERAAQKILSLLKDFSSSEMLKGSGLDKMLLASSSICSSDTPVHRLYEQANMALRVIARVHSVSSQMSYDDLGVFKLFFDVPDAVRKAYCQEQLQPLLEEDDRTNSNLINTLLYYLRFGGNIQQSAQQLFIHKNTLSYRLNRIKTILNVDINDPVIRNNLYNALMIYDVFYAEDQLMM